MHSPKKPPQTAIHPGRTVTVLSVEPAEEHRSALQSIFTRSTWGLCPDSIWKLTTSGSVYPALSLIRSGGIPMVLCESEVPPGTWKGMLDELRRLPDPPLLIVTSRLADERLWAEALNLGAHDVLSKPFESAEVIRVLSQAWLHWESRHAIASDRAEAREAAVA